jgi:Coiled-coil domain-containing protein 124 /Oxs1
MAPRERREAKADREASAAAEKSAKAKQDEEDAYWRAAGEGEKSKSGKKKDAQEAARSDAAAKKAEAKRLADLEEKELAVRALLLYVLRRSVPLSEHPRPHLRCTTAQNTGKRGGKVAPPKVTAAQLAAAAEAEKEQRERQAAAAKKAARKEVSEDAYDALVSSRNSNREEDTVEARGLDSALAAVQTLSLGTGTDASGAGDKHPEKRMKAAWAAYEAAELPRLQEDKPELKRQQYRDMLWKSWQKSPNNPLNQAKGSSAALAAMSGPPDSDDEGE